MIYKEAVMGEFTYNKAIVKNINENLIRKAIQGRDGFTKTKIARQTGLSFPTVSRILDEMEQSGEILLSGTDQTTGGRHANEYQLNPAYAYILSLYYSLDLHVTSIVYNALGDETERSTSQVEGTLGESLISPDKGVHELIRRTMEKYRIKAITLGIPCGVSSGKILYGVSAEAYGYRLREDLERTFSVKVRVENDMNMAAAGCYARMFHEGERVTLACISFQQDGCGCGLYARGHLLRGAHGSAGELRFLPMDENKNLHEYFVLSLSEEKRIQYFSQAIASVCAVIDPGYVVIYQSAVNSTNLEAVKEKTFSYLPEDARPEIILCNSFVEDFERGLKSYGMNLLLSGYQIVNQ